MNVEELLETVRGVRGHVVCEEDAGTLMASALGEVVNQILIKLNLELEVDGIEVRLIEKEEP